MEKVRLTEICNPKQWKTLSVSQLIDDGQYLVYGANGVIGYYDTYNHEKETVLITCRGATCGNIHISKEKSYINGNAMALDDLDEEKCLKRYLYYFLKQYDMKKIISGSAQPQITVQSLKKIDIKIIDKNEQIKIIDKLDNVQEIIDIRKKQIDELDELIKSQFVEMFGNVKESVRLSDCCDVHARIGWQALTKSEHMKSGEYMLITGTDFKNNEIDYSTCVYVSKARYEMDKNIILKNDDILITKDGTIGKVAIVHNLSKPATLNGGVFVVRPKDIFNKEYIAYVFKGHLFTEFVNKSKTGAIIKHLNQKHLIEFEIPKPSLEEQIRFSNIYKQIDKQKFEIQKSLEEMKELQESLMNKYFS